MFGRWPNARIKAARLALKSGRLDDAFERLRAPEVRRDSDAGPLIRELGVGLLARARLQLQAGKYREALDDLDRLREIGLEDGDAALLRERAAHAWKERADRHEKQDGIVLDAQRRIDEGRLESGRLAVDRIVDTPRREELREALDLRVQRSEQLLSQAEAAQRAGDVLTACRLWSEAVLRHGRTIGADRLAAVLLPLVRAELAGWIREGRLDRFRGAVQSVSALRQLDPHWDELERDAQLVRSAASQLAAGEFYRLRETLLRLQGAHRDAKWIGEQLAVVREILEGEARLLSSPLGLIDAGVRMSARFGDAVAAGPAGSPAGAPQASAEAGAELSRRGLLLLVDGTCSCLLASGAVVRLGRAGSRVDVPLPGNVQAHHADIIRDGEDYFLAAIGPTRVNQRPVQRVLLRDGDRIVLADSAKMTFHQPSAKSATAVLRLSSRSRLPQDVECVVLFDGVFTLGPHQSAHVRTREGETRVVVYEWEGRLYARSDTSGQARVGRGTPLPLGVTRDFGDLRLTVKEYTA